MILNELDIVETLVEVQTFFDAHVMPAGSRGTVVAAMDDDDAVTVSFAIGRSSDIAEVLIKDLLLLSPCPRPTYD